MATRRIREFLDGGDAEYVIISHSPAYTAQEVAESAHIPGRDVAKTVVVEIDGRLALAVVPATRHVDLYRLCAAAGAEEVRLADESDFADRFEGCQLGAVPPFGNLFGMETYVDRSLARERYIAFSAGSHTELIATRFGDYRRLARPKLVQIAAAAGYALVWGVDSGAAGPETDRVPDLPRRTSCATSFR